MKQEFIVFSSFTLIALFLIILFMSVKSTGVDAFSAFKPPASKTKIKKPNL